ncbi:MAG TPA: M14 family zinc carboxypeptidase [Candidatus Cloacimonadota bacterium]|nr:M14 family zinc carboxypeptidase [Candidatus Cloacimonadota bacterium]HQL15002.1 M14 family zinc carboxypeptidase [Candidatus Cloacimonadota bacterium]
MKQLIIAMLFLLTLPLLAGEWTEYYFKFQINDKSELQTLTQVISIANVKDKTVWAFANDDEWAAFQRLGYTAELLPNPSSQAEVTMRDSGQNAKLWDSYPTYDAYVAQMYAFQTNYPALCQIIDAGTTVNGRKILFAKISDNVATHEAEPEVMYTSTIHGNETCGYVLMLRLIDYLLSNYNTDARVQNLVNNLEIWINPNANPDGTYYGGNSSVSGARRYNANGIDLNRSFPDVWGGTTQTHQIENTIMENLANAHHFVISANFHGGTEVVNYPWDGTTTRHIDNDWFIDISSDYVNTARQVNASYMTALYSSGITNGSDWYIVYGGRQDWMNYNKQCREVTIELSTSYILSASQLPAYWNYNCNSFLGYLENALYGLQGTVKDAYGNPLAATINVIGHDDAHSKATTDPACGDYIRMLLPGTYTVQVTAAGYEPQTFNNVVITDGQKTTLNVVFGQIIPTQEISLTAGWNLISLNVEPSDLSVGSVLSGIGSSVLQIKDTKRTFSPAVASYFNTLSSINLTNGYWINLSAPATLTVTGTAVDPLSRSINLQTGWNLISYLPENALSVSSALASVSSYLQEVRSITQIYIPGGGSNTLTTMTPGQGYWIKVSQPCTLTYPSVRK